MTSSTAPIFSLTQDQIDDLLYYARVGDSTEFNTLKTALCKEGCSIVELLEAAVDEESGNGVLHMCAANGHADLLWETSKSLLTTPGFTAIVNKQNSAGNTPLHWAALNGHLATVQRLLELGADPTLTNHKGHDAVFEAELADKGEVVEWVLKMCEGLETGVGGEGESEQGEEVGEDEEGMERGESEMERKDGEEQYTPINDLSVKLVDEVQKMELDDKKDGGEPHTPINELSVKLVEEVQKMELDDMKGGGE